MIDLKPIIEQVKRLVEEDTAQSLTYAALECRLAIEKICYDRLRLVHDYISHAHLKRWQPAAVVNTLIAEVDPHAATTRSFSMSRSPASPDGPAALPDDDYIELGTQVGFDSKKLGSLWNALSGLALHVGLPRAKSDDIPAYGDKERVQEKVLETLSELEHIASSNLALGAIGPDVSFSCPCGALNKRKIDLLAEGQIVICVNPDCDESFSVTRKDDEIYFRRLFQEFECSCGEKTPVAHRTYYKMRQDAVSEIECPSCKGKNRFVWQIAHAKPTED